MKKLKEIIERLRKMDISVESFNKLEPTLKLSFIMLAVILIFGLFQTIIFISDKLSTSTNNEDVIDKSLYSNNQIDKESQKINNNRTEYTNSNVNKDQQQNTVTNSNTVGSSDTVTNSNATGNKKLPTMKIFSGELHGEEDSSKTIYEELKKEYQGKVIFNENEDLSYDDMARYNINKLDVVIIYDLEGKEVYRAEVDIIKEEIINVFKQLGIN